MAEMTAKRAIRLVWMHHYEITMSREDEDDIEDAYFYLGDIANTGIDFPSADDVVREIRETYAVYGHRGDDG